jgi:hypothetical protein
MNQLDHRIRNGVGPKPEWWFSTLNQTLHPMGLTFTTASLGVAEMMASAVDEHQLPAMYMVWPTNQLPSPPPPNSPDEYVVRRCLETDLGAVRANTDGPESACQSANFQVNQRG